MWSAHRIPQLKYEGSIEDYVANKDVSLLCNLMKETDISEVHAASFFTLMMKAVCLLKCLYTYKTTQCHIPEGYHLHTCCYENLKFHCLGNKFENVN
jgi:hypothetical protein